MKQILTGAASLALAVLAVSCGASPGPDAGGASSSSWSSSPSSSSTVLVEDAVSDTAPARVAPVARIIPVDGDLAEIVFALGLGSQVIATDISATYPPEADALPEVGYQRALAAEPIAALDPTILLATDLAGPDETLADLDRLGIETVVIERESDRRGPGNKIRAVAAALGLDKRGSVLADAVDQEIDAAIVRAAGASTAPRVGVLYLRGQNVQLMLGEGSGVDWLVDAAGAIDIADELGIVDHAPINTEALIKAAPDVLIIPSRGLESVGGIDGLLDVPGIAETPAGQNERILAYDDQLLLGNGPRTGDFLDRLITDLHGDI